MHDPATGRRRAVPVLSETTIRTVLVLGGYGTFGGRLCRRLSAHPGLRVVVAGRSLAKARDFCAGVGAASLIPAAVDRDGDLAAGLRTHRPWLLIDAAGPFQAAPLGSYPVAGACIAHGVHYLDLADARSFVAGFGRLDATARRAGVVALSGASSVPALSGAAADALAADLARVETVAAAISPGNRAPRGASVVRAILSFVGRPVRVWRDGEWRRVHGWQELERISLEVPGWPPLRRRWLALCDVPDLELFPARYGVVRSVTFKAGLELGGLHLGLWLLSWPVRLGLIPSIVGLAPLARAVAGWFEGLGTDRGGMVVEVTGRRRGDGAEVRRRWTLVAEEGDGPFIPCLAAECLVRKLASGEPIAAGARPCLGELTLDDFGPGFARLRIATVTREFPEARPLYERVLGDAYRRLPEPVRAVHTVRSRTTAVGRASVTRGRNPLARLVARLFRLPPAAGDVPVAVTFEAAGGREVWVRDFGGRRFRSTLSAGHGRHAGRLVERFGPFAFVFEVPASEQGLAMELRATALLGLPLPRFLNPRVRASERAAPGGRFAFEVDVALPLLGRVVRYAGWLERPTPA